VLVKKNNIHRRFGVNYRRPKDVTTDWFPLKNIRHPGYGRRSQKALSPGYEKPLWASCPAPQGQGEHSVIYLIGTSQRSGNVRVPDGNRSAGLAILSGILHDVIAAGQTFREQPGSMPKVVQRFRGSTLKLNTEKCKLFQEEVRYLSRIESPKGMTTDPENNKDLR
jgi:hypothetical protein